jgi:hypothetical protein
VFAADAGLWELNRFLLVTHRLQTSCQKQPKMKMAIQDVMLQHDFQRLARAASAVQAASFKVIAKESREQIDSPMRPAGAIGRNSR